MGEHEAPVIGTLRVATWNLERHGGFDRQALIEEQRLELLLAQEVTVGAYEALTNWGYFDWAAFSLDHSPRSVRDSRSERLGVAVFGRHPIALRSSGILPWLRRPEKLVFVELVVPGWKERITAASFHSSPGDGKPEAALQVAHWLELTFGPAVLGLDANSPDIDHPDHEQSVFHWQQAPFTHCEPALIGPPSMRRHRLDDAMRLWVNEHGLSEGIPADGPLACTYDRAKHVGRNKPSRFDSIWVSPEFTVSTINHLWDPQQNQPLGGSDHAMVVTELVRTPSRLRRPGQSVIDHIISEGLLDEGSPLHLDVGRLSAVDQDKVREWIGSSRRGEAALRYHRARPLEWSGGAGDYSLPGLAQHICAQAGAEFPSHPPGPHWWLTPDRRTLFEVSDAGRPV